MDQVTKYRRVLQELLERYAAIRPANEPTLKQQVIIDTERDHYQLLSLGHRENLEFAFDVIFHFDIIDGQIWLQCNNTDRLITDELIEAGVMAEDIVIGFVPEEYRDQPVSASA